MPPNQIPQISQGYVSGAGFDTVDAFPRVMVAAGAALTANQAYFVKVRFPRALRITAMLVYVTTQSGNIDVGLYDCATVGLHDTSSTLRWLASSGATAVGAANAMQSIALTAAVTVTPNKDYWLAIAVDNTSALARMPAVAAFCVYDLKTAQKATSYPLPTTTITTLGSGSLTPWIAAVGS